MAIENRFANQVIVTTAWPGVDDPAIPPDSGVWARPNILWGDGFAESGTGANAVVGLLRVQIFDRPGKGWNDIYEIGDKVRDAFNRVSISGVECGVPSGVKPATEVVDGWLQGVVDVPIEVRETVTV